MNPVTLKELRQLTRSRTISGAIVGYFLVQLVAAALVVVSTRNASGELDSEAGLLVFYWLGALLGPILAFVVPGNLFARLVSEHGPGRAELLAATALRPSALVDGKIRSGLALQGLFLAGALPFLLCSYLLGGLDVRLVLSWTFAVALAAAVALHVSLLVGALRVPAAVRWCAWALCAIPCVPFALLSASGYEHEAAWDSAGFLGLIAALAATACLVLRGAAVFLVAPTATDRARPLRLTGAALWFAWLAAAVLLGLFHPSGGTADDVREAVLVFSAIAGFGILPLAAFDLSSPSGPSRRVLLDRPRSRLRRLLRFPFSTGAEGGLAFALLFLAAGALLAALAWPRPVPAGFGIDHPGAIVGLHVVLAYLLAALLLARALLRLPPLARRGGVRFAALAAAALVGLAMLVPNLLAIGGSFDTDLSPLNIAGIDLDDWVQASSTVPVAHFGRNVLYHLRWAAGLLALGLLLHLRPFLRSLLAYVLSHDPHSGATPAPGADAKPAPRGRGGAVARAEETSE